MAPSLNINLAEGSWVWSRTQLCRGKVIEVEELWGVFRYRVWFPQRDIVLVHRLEELGDLTEVKGESSHLVIARLRYAAAVGRLAALQQDNKLLAPLDSAVIPLPHQIRALKRVVSTPKIRFLFADEVGLGKTVLAGLVIRELKLRGLVRRVLIIVPKGLIPQWIAEMRDKFGEDIRHLEPVSFAGYRQISGTDNVWKTCNQVICSLDSVKPLETRRGWSADKIEDYNRDRVVGLASAGWDLIIFDEAHRVAGSADTVARHALARMVAEAAPYLLLLSATPHQGKTDSFHRLISLLDRDAFPDEGAVTRERVAPYVIRTEKRQAIDAAGKPLFKPRLTRLVPVPWGDHQDQKQLYEAVSEYIREGYNQSMREKKTHLGFLMILMQRLVTSSTRAIMVTLERRLEVLKEPEGQLELFPTVSDEDWAELDGQEQLETLLKERLRALKNERAEVELLIGAARKVVARGPDAKAEALLDMVYRLQQEENDPELKVLIFTEFVPTQQMLREYLESRGFSVVVLNGSMDIAERKDVQRQFSQTVRIMISTDAGGEGLNLQFCHVVINFDLGWRPMALEQRIGRVDRIGQKHIVKALNYLLEDSVEYRIQEVLQAKLKVIFEEFGVDKTTDVLDSAEGARMFDHLFIEALLHPENIPDEVESVTAKIKTESASHRLSRTLLGTLDASERVEDAVSSQPIGDLLETALSSYLLANGGEFRGNRQGAQVRWPGTTELVSVAFPGTEERVEGELIHLDHSRVRGMLAQLPRAVQGQPIPTLRVKGLGASLNGSWSLWCLRAVSFGHTFTRVFPVFLGENGRAFGPSARLLWERLPQIETEVDGNVLAEASRSAFQTSQARAQEEARELFDQLHKDHAVRWQAESEKGDYLFQTRLRLINTVGLAEVRGYRIREWEEERRLWKENLERERTLSPELFPLVIGKIIST